MKFADPKSDISFKKIFGDQRRQTILISFLDAVLGLKGPASIKEVVRLNPFQSPPIEGLRELPLDIRAVDHRGITFIVEMHVECQEGFAKRALYYTSKGYLQPIKKSDEYSKLNAVHFIGILDFSLLSGDEPLSRHLIINQNSQKQDFKDFELNLIELPKFKKELDVLENVIEKWMYFLKHTDELSTVPEELGEVEEIKEAFQIIDQHMWTQEEIDVYDYWDMKEGSYIDALNTARKDGEQKGLEKGLKDGEQKGLEKGLKDGEHKGLKKDLKKDP